MENSKLIDIENVVGKKNPKLRKWLPGFVFAYLKRVVHQEEINTFIAENRQKYGVEFAEAIIEMFQINLVIKGIENLPENGRYIVVSNHPLGGLDGIGLIVAVSKVRKDILFPVNDLLMNLNNLEDLFIPVNKHGSNKENIKLFEESFASDNVILYFPAGLCSRKQKGVICDLEWKKTIIAKARQHKRDIIPTYFEGRNRNFFYNLSNFRKKLGIKANIEMLYLVDEMYRQKGQTHTVRFGKPIPYTSFTRDKKDNEWADLLKKHIYNNVSIENKIPFEHNLST